MTTLEASPSSLFRDYLYHAHMLADEPRLNAFRAAMRVRLKDGDHVVEIGSGTGILSLLAAQTADVQIDSIEFYDDISATATENLAASPHKDKIRFHRASSFNWKSERPVHGMFSETIGSWGPEEGIVEIFADFATRNPDAKWLMPSRLSLMAQEVRLDQVVRDTKGIQSSCKMAENFTGSSFGTVESRLLDAYHCALECSLFGPSQGGVQAYSDPLVVRTYELGKDKTSGFETEIQMHSPEANAFHVWFEAELAPGVVLSNHMKQPATHWRHLYVPRKPGGSRLAISYDSGQRNFEFGWEV